MRSENLYWVWLAEKLGVASKDLPRLMVCYRSPYDVYSATPEELAEVEDLSAEACERLGDKSLTEASQIIDYCAKTGVQLLTYNDEDYPRLLHKLRDPPAVLYVRGALPPMNKNVCIAIVGTRRMSEYGRDNAFRFAYERGAADVIVVSGLALGIDGVAAGGAISGHGRTVAVLGCGIDRIYPSQHRQLAGLVVENGAIVTEFAPGTPPTGSNFPIRNRIISGMCHGTLVVEADEHSGAMITAKCADLQGRQVFAVPGNIGEENTAGPNVLIRDGGLIAVETEDILVEYSEKNHTIDIPRMLAARRRYSFSDETLTRMGIFSRTADSAPRMTDNTPSAPRAAFAKKGRRAAGKVHCDEQPEKIAADSGEDRLTVEDVVSASPIGKVASHVEVKKESDRSSEILATLDERCRLLFSEMPDDRAVNFDTLSRLGFTVGEVMSMMTTLEIQGLVSSLPGGLYIKR